MGDSGMCCMLCTKQPSRLTAGNLSRGPLQSSPHCRIVEQCACATCCIEDQPRSLQLLVLKKLWPVPLVKACYHVASRTALLYSAHFCVFNRSGVSRKCHNWHGTIELLSCSVARLADLNIPAVSRLTDVHPQDQLFRLSARFGPTAICSRRREFCSKIAIRRTSNRAVGNSGAE